jgi:uncharacterized protein YlxP (DUF503 family)
VSKRNKSDLEAGTPVIGLLLIELHFPEARSLKTKRMVVKSVKDRLRRRFNIAIAETGYLELWQRAELAAVSVSGSRKMVEAQLEAVHRELEDRYSSELLGTSVELIE